AVTGVQTCALPILVGAGAGRDDRAAHDRHQPDGRRDRPQPRPLVRPPHHPERRLVSAVATKPVVRVEDLCLRLQTGEPVVDGVTFSVAPGEIVGLVGESGSGKTTTALALLGYTRPGVVIKAGTVEVGGESILGRDRRALRGLRGK